VLNNEAQAATSKLLLSPVSAAATANATSSWIDVRDAVGDIMFVNQVGALTGTLVWTIEHATDNSGTGSAAITPNEGAYATVAANQIQKRTISANACKGFVRCVGTIVTGPALVAASVHARPHIV
jgi:hypothetical protein